MYLNTGSSKDVTLGGKLFKGDKSLKIYGPSYEHANATASKEELYQTERNGNKLNYTIPVPNGTYTVKTYHNELYWGLYGRAGGKGRRVFDIRLEGKLVKDDFDIFVENQNKAVVLTFTNIEVKDGKLNLDMVSSRDRASISGIELFGHGTQQAKKAAQAKLDQVAEALVVEKAVDLVEVDNALEVKLYPNPASEFTNLSLSQDVALTHILIHDMNGQLMKQFDPRMLKKDGGQYQVPLDNLSNGLYLVSVVGEREVVDRLRLIVR